MLQRIGIAQTMIHHPDVIFLDEPMSGLDPLGRRLIKDIIREMKAEGRTVFLNTHILSDVEEICDRCMIIDHGRVVLESSVSDLSEPLEELFTRLVSGEIA